MSLVSSAAAAAAELPAAESTHYPSPDPGNHSSDFVRRIPCFGRLARELAGDLGNNCEIRQHSASHHGDPRIIRHQLTMQSNNAKDEDQRKNEHDDGVDLEAGALVRVKPYSASVHHSLFSRDTSPSSSCSHQKAGPIRTQHRAAAPARASAPRARRPRIRNLLLLVRRRAPPDHRPRAAGRRGRRGPDVGASAGAGGGGSSGGRLPIRTCQFLILWFD